MKKILFLLTLLVLVMSLVGCNGVSNNEEKQLPPQVDLIDDNYRTFYQVFVGSFSDSNNDGFGDLRGLINRFDYLNDGNINSGESLGVQGIWLSPIFTSPSYHKYDVKDYYEIDWRFGSESDLKELAELCEARNVKLILDLVINHTSSSHEWFLQFKEARMNGDTTNKYYDYYTCVTADKKESGKTYQKIAGVDAWFECNFSGDMPELNFDNEEVRQAMLDVAKYYIDLGIDGFRFDAIKYVYFNDAQKSIDFWKWYVDELEKIKPDIYCVGECWSGETEIVDFYEAVNCFNFSMAQAEGVAAKAAKGGYISNYTIYMDSYQEKILAKDPNAIAMPFLSNHDMDRIAGAFVTDNYMKMAANLYLLTYGSPFIYYGEEIGMRGSRGSENTDANRRLAMLWGDEDGVKNPVGSTYPDDKQIQTTVKEQLKDENSLYNYYCKLISVRHKHPEIARGNYDSINCEKNLGGFLVEYKDSKILILHNTSTQVNEFDLSTNSKLTQCTFTKLSDSIGVGEAKLNGSILKIDGQTSVVIEIK